MASGFSLMPDNQRLDRPWLWVFRLCDACIGQSRPGFPRWTTPRPVEHSCRILRRWALGLHHHHVWTSNVHGSLSSVFLCVKNVCGAFSYKWRFVEFSVCEHVCRWFPVSRKDCRVVSGYIFGVVISCVWRRCLSSVFLWEKMSVDRFPVRRDVCRSFSCEKRFYRVFSCEKRCLSIVSCEKRFYRFLVRIDVCRSFSCEKRFCRVFSWERRCLGFFVFVFSVWGVVCRLFSSVWKCLPTVFPLR